MNMKSFLQALIMLMMIIPGHYLSGQLVSDTKTPVKLGVSTINVTPLTPVLMSGYSARKTPYTAIHDSLYASALFFTDGKTRILLITSDLIGYPLEFIDDLKKAIKEKTGIPAENIMVTAVHNHGGPVTKTYETNMPESVENYVKELREKLLFIAVDASKNPVPFRMGIGKGTCRMNMNRRQHFADGSVGLGKNPEGPCDHDVTVARMEDLNGNLIAIMLNWPCHATASGDTNYRITADWPGAAARYIKKQSGRNVVVAITAGASGDIDPVYGPGDSFRDIEGTGFLVGTEAWNVAGMLKTLPVYSLQAVNSSFMFPGKTRDKNDFPQTSHEKAPDVEIRLTGIRIGNLVMAGISGELMNEIGMKVKRYSPYAGTMVVTHCNGSSGYICTDKAFTEGGYEPRVSRLMPGVEQPLFREFMEIIEAL